MPFLVNSSCISENDLVISGIGREDFAAFIVKKNDRFNCRQGMFLHNDMIGLPWGSKLQSKKSGYIYLLKPTPELWTLSLPHRTQILYIADISLIISFLNVKVGKKVIESGTGSGSFTHSLARAVYPTGNIFTFEFHPERATLASQEFKSHGLDGVVRLEHRDVCKSGFGMENEVDSVFLDLPSPWEAIASAKKALKKNTIGRICCFSPCIEQVQRTCAELSSQGFREIEMFECLIRHYESRSYTPTSLLKLVGSEKGVAAGLVSPEDESPSSMIVSKPLKDTRGHTSYLTFAQLFPCL